PPRALAAAPAEPRGRLPRRHVAPRGHRRNQAGAPADFVVGDQAERRVAGGVMAAGAGATNDWRDVGRERRVLRRCGCRCCSCDEHQRERRCKVEPESVASGFSRTRDRQSRSPRKTADHRPPPPPPPRPRPGSPIVGSSVLVPRPRAGGVQPSIEGPFCTKRTSGLSGLPVRYCAPALPQNLPARSVALRLTVSSDWYRGSVWAHPENRDRSLLPWITTSTPNVLAISFALMMPSSVSIITT